MRTYLTWMHTVEFEGVSKFFAEKEVIRDISLSVEKGEIFGLLGPNGAGKTTLIRLLLDIIKPDSGEIKVFGSFLGVAAKDSIGYLPMKGGCTGKQRFWICLCTWHSSKMSPKRRLM
jgi:ABC-2 type transport system ATP-binding protein